MKTIKKYFKVALCFLALAICSVMFAIAPSALSVAALNRAQADYDVAISAIKLPTKAVNALKIPVLDDAQVAKFTGVANSAYIIRVQDPTGEAHDYNVNGTNTEGFFAEDLLEEGGKSYIVVNAKNSGVYKISFIITDANGKAYFSAPQSVTLKNNAYTLDFELTGEDAGLVALIKPEVAKGSSAIELPTAYARETDGETVSTNVEITATRNGAPLDLVASASDGDFYTADGKTYINPTTEGTYTVTYTYANSENRPNKTFTITVTDGFVNPSSLSVSKNITFPTFQLGDKDITLPKLTVNDNLNDNVLYNITKVVIQKHGSNIKQELTNNDLTFDMTTEAFNVESYTDLEGSYDYIYTVVDAYGNTTTETFSNINTTYKLKDVSGTPTVYFAYDYSANATEDEIDTTAKTTLKSEYGYGEVYIPAMFAEDKIADTDDLYMYRVLQNRKGTIFYVDNVRYNKETEKLEYVAEGETGHNYALAEVAEADRAEYLTTFGTFRKAVAFQFEETVSAETAEFAGDYDLYFHAVSKTYATRNTLNKSADATITVTNAAEITDATTPSIEITNVKNGKTLKNKEEILTVTINATDDDARLNSVVLYTNANIDEGTIVNYVKGAIASVLTDSNVNILKSDAFLLALKNGYTGSNPASYNADFFKATETDTANKYTIDFSDFTLDSTNHARVLAITLNDNGNVAVDTKTIAINDTDESDAPTYVINSLGDLEDGDNAGYVAELNEFGQNREYVQLPSVTFTDAVDGSLETRAQYYVLPEGFDADADVEGFVPTYRPVQLSFDSINKVNGKIVPTSAGTYYVVYSAMDDAGNVTAVYFTFKIVDTSKPILTVNATGDGITQTGNTVSAEVGSTIDFELMLRSADGETNFTEDADTQIRISSIDTNGESLNFYPSGDGEFSFKFDSVGTYTITFTANHTVNVGGVDEIISANDKVVYVNIAKTELKWATEFDVAEYAKENTDIYLPDIATNLPSNVKVTVKAPGKTAEEISKVMKDGYQYWTFKTGTTKGTYEIVYTATTDDQVLTQTLKIKVGDNVKPTISMNYEAELKQEIVYKDDIDYKVEIDRTNKKVTISAKSSGKTIYSYDLGLSISDLDDNGEKKTDTATLWSSSKFSVELTGDNVSGSSGEYTITGVGECTLTIKAIDSYENVSTKTIKFNVVNETETKTTNDTVVGTVLIVIALVVLAGVILFFTFTGNKGGRNKAKSNKKNIKADNKDTDEAKTGDVE